jgi:hypothetical protein
MIGALQKPGSPDLNEPELARVATAGALRVDDLEPLVDVMSALENSALNSALENGALENSSRAQGVVELARGLAVALGDDAALALCTGATGPADVAARFFRLRALLLAVVQTRFTR